MKFLIVASSNFEHLKCDRIHHSEEDLHDILNTIIGENGPPSKIGGNTAFDGWVDMDWFGIGYLSFCESRN